MIDRALRLVVAGANSAGFSRVLDAGECRRPPGHSHKNDRETHGLRIGPCLKTDTVIPAMDMPPRRAIAALSAVASLTPFPGQAAKLRLNAGDDISRVPFGRSDGRDTPATTRRARARRHPVSRTALRTSGARDLRPTRDVTRRTPSSL